MDTIAAISTPMGEGAIAIVRMSGPEALAIADKVYKGPKRKKTEYPWIHIRFITVISLIRKRNK